MNRRNIHRVHRVVHARTQKPLPFRLLLITIISVAVVAAGFFFAARQHFATMEFGLKNSQLRKQVENLEAERRRLLLAKEVSLSPAEVKQTASKLGFREHLFSPPSAVETQIEKRTDASAPAAELTSLIKKNDPSSTVVKVKEEKRLVKPIVQQATVKPASADERPRIAPGDRVVAAATSKSASKLR